MDGSRRPAQAPKVLLKEKKTVVLQLISTDNHTVDKSSLLPLQ